MERGDTAPFADVSDTQTQTKRQQTHDSESQPEAPESAPASECTAAQPPSSPSALSPTPKDKPDSALKTDKAGKLRFTQDEG